MSCTDPRIAAITRSPDRPVGDAARLIALLRIKPLWKHELEAAMPWVDGGKAWTRLRHVASDMLADTQETIVIVRRAFGRGCQYAIHRTRAAQEVML